MNRLLPAATLVMTTVMTAVMGLGCTQDPPRSTVHLRRPGDLALICRGTTGLPEPCSKTSARVEYFVTNMRDGTVARIDSGTGEFIDTDPFIPGFTPVMLASDGSALASRPITIVSSQDGKRVYIAGSAGRHVVEIDVTTGPTTSAPGARRFQALPSAPSALLELGAELLIALPEAGAVARIPLSELGKLATVPAIALAGGSPNDLESSADGKTLYVSHVNRGYVSVVDVASGAETARVSIAPDCDNDLDDNGDGLMDAADWGCRRGQGLTEQVAPAGSPAEVIPELPAAADRPACLAPPGVTPTAEHYPLNPYCSSPVDPVSTREPKPIDGRLARSPDGRWLYATNARDRSVAVLDLATPTTPTHVDVNGPTALGANPLRRQRGERDIALPGVPTDIAFALAEIPQTTAVDSPKRNQLVAYVSSATGEVFVLEAEDAQGRLVHWRRDDDHPANVRPGLDNVAIAVPAGSATPTAEAIYAAVYGYRPPHPPRVNAPELFDGLTRIELGGNRRADRPSLGEYVADRHIPPCEDDFRRTSYGIRIADTSTTVAVGTAGDAVWLTDPLKDRVIEGETWELTHGGAIVERQTRLLAWDGSTFVTPERVFCTAGAEVGDRLVVRSPNVLSCGGVEARALSYVIKSVRESAVEIVPGSGRVFEDAHGARVVDPSTGQSETAAPDPSAGCLAGKALSYEVRVPHGLYVVVGSASGYLHPWQAATDGTCERRPATEVPYAVGRTAEWARDAVKPRALTSCPPSDLDVDGLVGDAINECAVPVQSTDPLYMGTWFDNGLFRLRVIPGCRAVRKADGTLSDTYEVLTTRDDVRWRFSVDASFKPKSVKGMATPRRLLSTTIGERRTVFVVDSGLERVSGIDPSTDNVTISIF